MSLLAVTLGTITTTMSSMLPATMVMILMTLAMTMAAIPTVYTINNMICVTMFMIMITLTMIMSTVSTLYDVMIEN